MGYEIGYSEDSGMSGRKMAALFGLFAFAAFLVLALFVFPIKNLIRDNMTETVPVVIKQDGLCVVETSDHPRTISSCEYDIGDLIKVTYKQGMSAITIHEPA
jgi:hypothetical protein